MRTTRSSRSWSVKKACTDLGLPLLDDLLHTFTLGSTDIHQVKLLAELVQEIEDGLSPRVVLQRGFGKECLLKGFFSAITLKRGRRVKKLATGFHTHFEREARPSLGLTWKTVPCTGSTGVTGTTSERR